jgi:two-component system sensor histidine kinase PilS (NtrC family)
MKSQGERRELVRGLKWFMLARLFLITLLMGVSPFIYKRGATPFFFIIGALYFVTVIYSLLLRTRLPLKLQGYVQFFGDVAMVTLLLSFTGGIDSNFVLIYVLTIIFASLILGGQAGVVIAVSCSVMYGAIGIVQCVGTLPEDLSRPAPLSIDPLYVALMILVRATIFCILGYFADYLANSLYRHRRELDDLKKLNEKILAQLKSGIITTDAEGKIIFVNPVAEEILGYRRSEMMGISWHRFLGRPVEQIDDRWLAEEAKSFTRCEIRVHRKDGKEIPIGFTVSNLVDKEGIPLGLLILFRDLTNIHRMEERMRRADRLSAAGAILASVAHEVRTPLASIRGAVEVLKENKVIHGGHDRLMEVILKESDRLDRIVGDFISYGDARRETRTREDVNKILDEAISIVREGRRPPTGVRITWENDGGPVYSRVEAYKIKQAFINILDNALDAVRGDGNVSIVLERAVLRPEGKTAARIRFADSGEGMSAERMAHLFEPFYSTKESGTGMGLFLAERIVRDQGGQLEAESREGGGTMFTLTLPCEPADVRALR